MYSELSLGPCQRLNYVIKNLKGCLPFTRANWLVHGLGKWYAKFRTGKFRPGIAFTMYESVRKTKDGFEVMEHGFLFGIFRPEKQDY